MKKTTTLSIRKTKGKKPLVCVTAYDSIIARLADEAGVDVILVGDSMGTTVLGFDTTIPVTVEMIKHHCAAVSRATTNALVVADIPFAVAHSSFENLLDICIELMQYGGAQAVKIEGGAEFADKINRLVAAGIPVVGHIGLHPQLYYAMGGYKKFGKTSEGRNRLLADAKALQAAGAFFIIGEMIDAESSAEITKQLDVPFVGIGCGPDCDGQILVYTDLLGMTPNYIPSFAKQYASLGQEIQTAFESYVEDVREKRFPE